MQFSGDAHFLRQLQQIQLGGPWLLPVPPHFADWVQPDAFLSREKSVVFLSGPQLAGKAGQRAREMVAHGAHGIMTGTPDAGSLSAEMLKNGQMLWPVRVAVTGTQVTPGGAVEAAVLLGKEETLRRIQIGLERIGQNA